MPRTRKRTPRKKPEPKPETDLHHRFLWLDLETTGLEPRIDAILECAILLADDAPGGDWTEVESDTFTLHFNRDRWDAPIDPVVRDMHTRNGLWEACESAPRTYDIKALDDALCAIAQNNGATPRSIVLAGSSVHFDRSFLVAKCQRFAGYLNHRVLDVSTLKLLVGEDAWGDWKPEGTDDTEHRGLADIRYSLAAARRFISDFMAATP